MGFLFECLVFVKSLFGVLVECLEISDVWRVGQEVWEILIQLLDKHSELGAPVSNMINSLHVIVQELEYPANTVSLNSGSQMTNVHIFSDIRG